MASWFRIRAEEDNLLLSIEAREFERVEGGIDHARISAFGFCLQQALLRARHSHRVTEGCEGHARHLGKREAIVDPPHWQHANWASGSMHELNHIGPHSLDPELEDCMRVAAAHLHERERRTCRQSPSGVICHSHRIELGLDLPKSF